MMEMGNTEKVSIIVPIYNVGETLRKCVQSLVEQTYANIEILLIDDGSTDGSGELADQLQKKDERIKVIHKVNGGVTSARKAGWLASDGAYCLFIDADDYISPDAVDFLVDKIRTEKVEFVSGWRDIVFEDGKVERSECPFVTGIYDTADYIKMCLDRTSNLPTMCAGMFLRSVFNDKVFDIDPFFFRGEDSATVIGALNQVNRICVTNKVFYHYFQRSDSVTHAKPIDVAYVLKLKELQYQIFKDEYKKYFQPVLFKVLLYGYYHLMDEQKKKVKERLLNLYTEEIYQSMNLKDKVRWYCLKNIILANLLEIIVKIRNVNRTTKK